MLELMNLHSNVPISLENFLTLSGVAYEAQWIDADVTAGAKIYLVVTACANKYLVLGGRLLQMDQERGFYRVFADWTGGVLGALIPVQKLRSDGVVSCGATFQLSAAPDTIDTDSKLLQVPLFGAAGQGNVPTTGSSPEEAAFRIIPPGGSVLLEFENASVADSYVQLDFKFWEIRPASMPPAQEI